MQIIAPFPFILLHMKIRLKLFLVIQLMVKKIKTKTNKENISSIKNWKAAKTLVKDFASVNYAFELPRQQQDQPTDSEVMQFKTSQRLSNVNQPLPAVFGPPSAATNTVSQQPPPASSSSNSRPPSGNMSSLRANLKARDNAHKSPGRAPLAPLQQNTSGNQSSRSSSRKNGQSKNAFTFDDDTGTNDEHSENEMETSPPPPSSQFQQSLSFNESSQGVSTDLDPIVQQEDEVAQANDYDPQVGQRAREFAQTQAQTLVQRQDTVGEVADGYDRPIFRKLKKLGVVVKTNEDEEEPYFYMGELTHAKLINLIEKEWNDLVAPQIMADLENELANHPESWKLFLLPSKNINGLQDTIFRALILCKFYQKAVFQFLLVELNSIAVRKPNDEQMEKGENIINQLRFITEVFYPDFFYQCVFDKDKLEKWNPVLRDGLIEILPELFTDSAVHSEAANKLIEFVKDENLDERKTLHAACLKAIKCFEIVNSNTKDKIYRILTKNLMKFDIENISLAVETALTVIDKTKEKKLANFFCDVCQNFNIERLQRDEEQSESINGVEKCVSEVFSVITEFMRFNLNRSEKELLQFYNYKAVRPKSPARLKKSQKRANFSIDSDDDDNSDSDGNDEEEDNDDDPDYVPEGNEKSRDDVERDFTLFDVMLLLCQNEASNDSSLALKELRKQILLSHDNFINLKETIFRQVVGFTTFTEKYFGSILMLARNLLQSPNTQINQFGETMYQHLFNNPRLDRTTILKKILSHVGEVDYETTSALSVLKEIVGNHLDVLRNNHLSTLNALINNLSLLSTDNIRRLFFVLVSLNFYPNVVQPQPTQARIQQKKEGDKFIQRLRHYLSSNISGEIIWGVIGLVQYVNVLLSNSDDIANNEAKILEILVEINNSTKKSAGKIRAEFFLQLSELLKTMKNRRDCDALNQFGEGLTAHTQKRFYKPATSPLPNGPGNFDGEDFVDASVKTWINLADMVPANDDKLSGAVSSLLPLLQFLKDFANYRQSFLDDSGDPLKSTYWSSFMFILESNVNLNSSTSSTDNDYLHQCNILYLAVEYLRTVLNMFADCKYNVEKVQLWMVKKLNLMLRCQSHLNGFIYNKLPNYLLPRISHINKDDLIVKSKNASKSKKSKKKAADVENDEDSRQESIIIGDDDESHDATESEHNLFRFKLRKQEGPKKIAFDQLQWYFVPLRLETVTRLLQIKQTIRVNLFLVENFCVILKHTLPVRSKNTPAGLLLGGSGPQLPIATMNFVTKEERWNHISASIKPIFEQLHSAVHFLLNSTTQAFTYSSKNKEIISNTLKFCVMIFSRIFQSHEIATECDHQDTDRTGNLMSRRTKILSDLNEAINVFNSSNIPQGSGDTTHQINASAISQNDMDLSHPFRGRISDPTGISGPFDENRSKEENVVNFFLGVAKFVSTMESASALLALFKTFTPMEEHLTRNCAEVALNFLSKTWAKSDDEESENLDERNAILIATDYIHFRSDDQKLCAINWLIWHQLLSLYPNSILRDTGFEVGDSRDPADYVHNYTDMSFPCFQKIPQWHKMLFKQFNDILLKTLKTTKHDHRICDKTFVRFWENHIQTFYLLLFVLNNPGFRVHNVLYTLIREGKRFISFIGSKSSSFAACLRSEDSMKSNHETIGKSLKYLHSANKLLYDLQVYVKNKKNAALLKLIPELKAAQEKMARGLCDAAAAGGFKDIVHFNFSRAKKIVDAEKTPKKGEKSAAKKKPKDKSASKKSKTNAPKKRTNKSTDGPAKKRAKKSKDAVIETPAIDDSIRAFDSTRDNSGYVDVEDESDMEMD